jgi:hypothetical protein
MGPGAALATAWRTGRRPAWRPGQVWIVRDPVEIPRRLRRVAAPLLAGRVRRRGLGSVHCRHGEKVDRASLKSLPSGSFIHLPAGMPHDAAAEAETVLRFNGICPFDAIHVNLTDDPRKKWQPARPSRPSGSGSMSRRRNKPDRH